MKEEIHPTWYPEAKIMLNNQVIMTTGSTVPEMQVEIWSGNHPFYTGKQQLVDTTGTVDRFKKRTETSAKIKETAAVKKPRKTRVAAEKTK